jgi:arylsulfatase A-like enzyme
MAENNSQASRRQFLQGSLALAGTMLTSKGGGAVTKQPGENKRPNIVFFFGEGQRADALSIAGNPLLKTPNHDRIGREGVRFTNAFCTNALCAPARAIALTGMYSKSTSALGNRDTGQLLPADIPILTDLLHEAGYEVAIVGKVHIRNGVEERYWDYYFGHNAPGNNYYNPFYKEGRKGKIEAEQQFHDVYADDLAVDRALAWLKEERGDKPFCLLVWFVAPHSPFYRPRRHLDLYNGVPIPKPATFDDDLKGYPGRPRCVAAATNKIGTTVMGDTCRSLEEVVKDYYAGLVGVDDNIGRILSYLEEKQILDDTAIFQGSDHGYFLGEWRMYDKRLMYEPSIRVPMMIRYPSRIPAGMVRDEMALDIDITPTILDLAGVPIPKRMQGKSLVSLAKEANLHFREDWYYQYFDWPNGESVRPCRGVRTERYKLIEYLTDPREYEMFDLQADPGELHNLYGKPEHSDLQTHLTARMNQLDSSIPEYKNA